MQQCPPYTTYILVWVKCGLPLYWLIPILIYRYRKTWYQHWYLPERSQYLLNIGNSCSMHLYSMQLYSMQLYSMHYIFETCYWRTDRPSVSSIQLLSHLKSKWPLHPRLQLAIIHFNLNPMLSNTCETIFWNCVLIIWLYYYHDVFFITLSYDVVI